MSQLRLSKLITAARPLLKQQLRAPRLSFSSSVSLPNTSADPIIQEWKQQGIIDERDLLQFETLHEMQVRACKFFEPRNLFSSYNNSAQQFEWMTYGEFASKVDHFRAALHDLDIGPGSKVALISNNRMEWAALAAASFSLNASVVPMYEAQLAADWTYILNDSGASVLFCANDQLLAMVRREVLPNTPKLRTALSMDAALGQQHALATLLEANQPDVGGKLIQAPGPDDLANLIYTSGTTGKPKGVELTHSNFSSNLKSAARTTVKDPHDFIQQGDCSLAFLPWAHSYGQTCELWMSIAHGVGVGIGRGVPFLLEDLQLVKPTVLFAVPAVYKRVYDGVHNLIESSSPVRKTLMQRALTLGAQHLAANTGKGKPLGLFERWQYSMLDQLVLDKIRARFGGRLRHGFVAAAACPKEVLHFMDIIGIPICEGYGLTETSPIIAINSPEQRSIGTVGRPIGGVDLFIIGEDGKEVPDGEDGEICCAGPNVMRGYYKNPQATAEVISKAPDGVSRMFHTGDMGRKTSDGFLKVTGRLKEQYKLENGKYIVPTPIEEAIGMSRFITQVVLTGANRPHNVALLVLEWPAIRAQLKVDDNTSEDELSSDVRVKELIDKEIKTSCARLKKFEIPQAWAIVAPFTAANNMLTPKMSIRRHQVVSTYTDVIAHMYGGEKDAFYDSKEQVAA